MAGPEAAAVTTGMKSGPADEIRHVVDEHIPAILEIEKSAYEFPWTEGLLRDCLKPNYYFYALFRQQDIIAYAIMSCLVNEAHILNLCVSPQYQRQGLGRQMLDYLLDKAREEESHTVFLEVRESNSIAQGLYEKNGFNRLGSRRGYYPNGDGREDAILFAKELMVNPF
ncbi:MAG: ribosomal protein S18-alanine N-acetyltransferase [Gammaproteobacteria bacterium]|nr:ribosomal protein S18-alanine N-acetyltransferase [Gammaproteobacteria bacterium]